MKNAEMKLVRFRENDVVATSNFVLSGFFDGEKGNLKLSLGSADVSNTYFTSEYTFKFLDEGEGTGETIAFMNTVGGDELDFYSETINNGFATKEDLTAQMKARNGIFIFDAATNTFTHQ